MSVGYAAVHRRVRKLRGAAKDHPCADCAAPAADWAYSNAAADELFDDGTGCSYSTNPDEYRPLCKPCHRAADAVLAGRRAARRQEVERAAIHEAAQRIAAAAPPVTDDQRARLRLVLHRQAGVATRTAGTAA